MPNGEWRLCETLHDMLQFTAGKAVRTEHGAYAETPYHAALRQAASDLLDITEMVEFDDGTLLAVCTTQGFRGSDVTAPDPVAVEWFVYTPDLT